MKPLHYYLIGAGSWFLAYGIQVVAFAWIVTIILNESAKMVGIAQMAFMVPATLFMLIGGSLADQVGGRRVAIAGHVIASLAPLFLFVVILNNQLDYATLLIFAVIMGTAQALITPSRDGLLSLLAKGDIQQKVAMVSFVQFGLQLLGFVIASFADHIGALAIMAMQFFILLLGALAFLKLKVSFEPPPRLSTNMMRQIVVSVYQGFQTVKSSSVMTLVVLLNIAMGLFFMGSYTVTLPILIREIYQGSANEISWANAGNALGLVTTIVILLRYGDVKYKGRALIFTLFFGCFALAGGALGLGMTSLITFIYCWGMCGGICMTMSRTIMQMLSPESQRGRIMSFYSFSLMGSGPFGALLSGYLCEWLGPTQALTISASLMLIVVVSIFFLSELWETNVSH